MADYGAYDSGTGDVISAIQRPALDIPTEQERIRQNLMAQGQMAAQQAQLAPYQQADALINNAIIARQNIEARREQLARQLTSTSNRRAAFGLAAQIEGLDRAAHGTMQDAALGTQLRLREAAERRMMTHQDAEMAAQALKTDRSAAIDQQGAALLNGLGRLNALQQNGSISTEDYNNGLLDLGQQYGLGLRHPVAGRMFNHFITEADRQNAFDTRRLSTETTRLAGRYGIQPQIDPDTGLPSLELTHQAALQTDKGRGDAVRQMNTEMLQKYGVPTGVSSLFNPVAPHTSDDNNKTINLPFLNKKGEIGSMKIPYPLFNQMKADFQDRYNQVVPSAGPAASQASPTVQPQQQAAGGLQVGATRSVGGVNYAWNGSRWEQQ